MIMRSLLAALSLVALTAGARADESTPPPPAPPPAAWQTRCADVIRAAKDEMIKRELITETSVDVGDFGLPEFAPGAHEEQAPMVKLEYFVSHGRAVTIYVWRRDPAAKSTGWRDVDPFKSAPSFRLARDRGSMHAQIGAADATGPIPAAEAKQFRAILSKAADACLK